MRWHRGLLARRDEALAERLVRLARGRRALRIRRSPVEEAAQLLCPRRDVSFPVLLACVQPGEPARAGGARLRDDHAVPVLERASLSGSGPGRRAAAT